MMVESVGRRARFYKWLAGGWLLVFLLVFLLGSLPAWAAMISTEKEIEIGRSSSQKIEARYGLYRDAEANRRIQALGRLLVKNTSRGLTYHFKILNQDIVNAFAFPGGYIYLTKGIYKAMKTRELAFVLGHEITHVEKRHSVKEMERALMTQLGGGILVGLLGGDHSQRRKLSTLVGMTDFVMGNRYSQSQEKEADEGGMILMTRAGFDPQYAVEALQVLKQNDKGQEDSQFVNSLLSSHPLTSDRIEGAQGRVEGLRQEWGVAPGSAPKV